ncbi:MAG: glycosyltransferase family A protein [Thermodesulfobacteriota bacterium]
MTNKNPYISVIIPAYNSTKFITPCLKALDKSTYKSYEVILVDDGSTDDTAKIARDMRCRVFETDHQSGPAVARNHGSEKANGEILLFIDSDVLVKSNTLELVASTFSDNPDISALFGSYDDTPSDTDFLSQYRNLLHHYVHQKSKADATTFWAGCGAVRKNIFLELNGYDYKKFAEPSIEDIELGYRMREKGYKIRLDKDLQVTHLKHWGWYSMIKTDIFNRAMPWSRLILQTKSLPEDLNLRISDRVSTALVGTLLICLSLIILNLLNLFSTVSYGLLLSISAIIVISLIFLNRDLYGFFLDKRGLLFTAKVIPLHFLYYFYCGASFGICWIQNKLGLLKTNS